MTIPSAKYFRKPQTNLVIQFAFCMQDLYKIRAAIRDCYSLITLPSVDPVLDLWTSVSALSEELVNEHKDTKLIQQYDYETTDAKATI